MVCLNPYELRQKALNEKLSLEEIGRIFYHLIQRRGFLSNSRAEQMMELFLKEIQKKEKLVLLKRKKVFKIKH
jgi:CRISPR/Cas system Type II protein with McrA/HNH and RuvC-like nuclease domain